MKIQNNKLLIRGIIRVYDKDKSGNALQLFLQTDEFEKFIIENTKKAEKLFFLIDEEILVKGRMFTVQHESLPHLIVESIIQDQKKSKIQLEPKNSISPIDQIGLLVLLTIYVIRNYNLRFLFINIFFDSF